MKQIIRNAKLVLAAAACLAPAFGAAIETYNSVGAWQSAGTQAGLVTFTGVTSTNYATYSSGPVQFGGVPGGNLFGVPSPFSYQNLGEGAAMLGPSGGMANFLRISFSTTVYGVGLLVGTQGNPGDGLNFVMNGATGSPWNLASTAVLPASPGTFFGLRSDMPITTLDVYTISGTSRLVFDSVRYSIDPYSPPPPPNETPEAGTMVLIGSGLFGLRWLKRRAMSGAAPA